MCQITHYSYSNGEMKLFPMCLLFKADGDNEDTWIFDLVQIGVWHELKFELEVNSVLQGAPFYHTIEGSDMHVYFDTSLAVSSHPLIIAQRSLLCHLSTIFLGPNSNITNNKKWIMEGMSTNREIRDFVVPTFFKMGNFI